MQLFAILPGVLHYPILKSLSYPRKQDLSDASSSLDVLNTPVGSAQIQFIDTDPTSKLKNAEQFA